jgi:hypothetical protein
MVQLSALAASLIGRWVHFDPSRLRLLVACGAAAGITSAYSAPSATNSSTSMPATGGNTGISYGGL